MIQKSVRITFYAILIILSSISCKRKGKYDIDVSGIPVHVDIIRLEDKLFSLPEENFEAEAERLKDDYPYAYKMYVENILGIGSVDDTRHYKILKRLLFDKYWREVYAESQKKFKNLEPIRVDIEDAFKHIKYYYPKDSMPQVFTLVKGIDLRYKVVTYKDVLGISLDLYLGKDFKYYPSIYPEYIIRSFQKEYIIPDILSAYFTNKYPEANFPSETLLDKMVYQGKRLFFMDVMAPHLSDTLKTRYTKEKLDWAEYYQGDLWQILIENNYLYETNQMIVSKFFTEAPFTNVPGFPQDPPAPPRIGEFIGWQIVKKYMEENDDVTIMQLFEEKDAQKILKLANYKPKTK